MFPFLCFGVVEPFGEVFDTFWNFICLDVGGIKRFTVDFHQFLVFGMILVNHSFQEVRISRWAANIFRWASSLDGRELWIELSSGLAGNFADASFVLPTISKVIQMFECSNTCIVEQFNWGCLVCRKVITTPIGTGLSPVVWPTRNRQG